jgi:hypothetical protein
MPTNLHLPDENCWQSADRAIRHPEANGFLPNPVTIAHNLGSDNLLSIELLARATPIERLAAKPDLL